MDKIEKEVVKAKQCLLKLASRRVKLKQTIVRAQKCDEDLERKEQELENYLRSVKLIRSSVPDFIAETSLPTFTDLPFGWFQLQYESINDLKRWFKGCIQRAGCKRRQWCVIDISKMFLELFVVQNPGAIKLEQKHQRIYFYNREKNDYTRYETPTEFRGATSKLGRFFNGLVGDYLERVNREKRGHAAILHDKGLDVVAPYCAFNYWDFDDHKRDFIKPLKLYDDRKLVYQLNKSTDNFRNKFPKLYKILNPPKTNEPTVIVV